MSQIDFLMAPEKLFEILDVLSNKHQFRVIFRRYKSERFEAGYFVPRCGDNFGEMYLDGGYREIYLSLEKTPLSEKDWGFYENNFKDLIEINGGRIVGNLLEKFVARLVAKKSNARRIFADFVKTLKSNMSSGGIYLNKTKYPNIYYDEAILSDYKFTDNVLDPSYFYTIVSSG